MLDAVQASPAAGDEPLSVLGRRSPSWSGPQVPPWAIIGVAVLACGLCGRFIAEGRTKYAAVILLAAVFGPVAFFDLAAALAVWVAVLFVQDLRVLSSGPNAIGVLVALGWLGAFVARSGRFELLKGHRGVLVTTLLFCIWLTLSTAWAQDASTAASQAGSYWLSGLALLVVITTVRSSREASVVALAFVLGAAVAAVIGLAGGSLDTATNAAGQTAVSGRLTGGGGDPNLQAAAFVAAMFVCIGLMGFHRRRAVRIGLVLALALITVAFFKTESRGGLIALIVAAIAAVVLSPGRRRAVLNLFAIVATVACVVLAVSPGAFTRITDVGGGTSGRNEIWRVAWLVFEQHPVLGVGANNFSVVEPNYALDLNNATYVGYIAETPQVIPAHNSYLQMLADAGVIGLVAFLAAIIACLRAGWLAARIFDRTGRPAHAQLARACLMGSIGFLTAIFFITDGWDFRLWILLGLGPALLALARRSPAPEARPRRRRRAGRPASVRRFPAAKGLLDVGA